MVPVVGRDYPAIWTEMPHQTHQMCQGSGILPARTARPDRSDHHDFNELTPTQGRLMLGTEVACSWSTQKYPGGVTWTSGRGSRMT